MMKTRMTLRIICRFVMSFRDEEECEEVVGRGMHLMWGVAMFWQDTIMETDSLTSHQIDSEGVHSRPLFREHFNATKV